jgi:polyhydroxybutyrate depolymerase
MTAEVGGAAGSMDGAPGSELPPGTNATIDENGEAAVVPAAGSDTPESNTPASDADLDVGAGCPASTNGASSPPAPGDLTETITVGALTRTFIRRVPPGYTGATPVPVVIDFHPRGSNAMSWKGSTSWADVADARGFIVVWPNGVQNSWNVGERCCGPAHDQNVDDVGFTRAMLTALERDLCIDRRRIYATGCSNGGDQVVPYEGGVSAVNAAITFPGAPANFATWGQINSCTGEPSALPGLANCETFSTCGAGVETTLCTVQNGTHCGSYDSFDIVNIAWERMSSAALP